jgi:hypothetical protein
MASRNASPAEPIDRQELRPSCDRHPRARAGWECRDCKANLCPDCAATRNAGTSSTYVVCVACGGAATRLMARRSQLRPFTQRLREAPAFPANSSVFVALVALAAFRTFLSYRGFAPVPAQLMVAGASVGSFWAYMFYVIRHTAAGQLGLLVPDFRDVKEDLIAPAIKGGAGTALIWAPALLYLLLRNDWDFSALTTPANFADPVIWLLVLAGVAYCPMALVAAATDVEVLGILNPVQVVRSILAGGRDYALTVLALVLMAIPGVLIELLLVPALRALPVPFLCRWLAEIASLYVPFVMARMMGTFLRVHGDVLDWGSPADYQDPVLDAQPRGTAPAGRPSVESVPVEAPAPVEAPPPAAPPTDAVTELIRALATRDEARALSLYTTPGFAAQSLSPDQHFAVGSAAANAAQFPVAVRALKVAAFSSHEIAPRALITLARVYADGLQDGESADRLFREAIRRFPDSPAASFAQQQLASR